MPVINPSGGGGGGSQTVQSATVTLASAQIKALHDAPVQLAAAPGANKAILVFRGYAELHAGAIAYGVGIIGGIPLGYAGQSDMTGTNELGNLDPNFLTGAADSVAQLGPPASNGTWPIAEANNKALVIFATDQNPTAGNGTLDITVFYAAVTLS